MTVIMGEGALAVGRRREGPPGVRTNDRSHSAAACGDRGAEQAEGPGQGVLERAFYVLEAVSCEGAAGLSQLARLAGLPKATTYRLLNQLVAVGAVERVRSGYRVGPAVHQLSSIRPSHAWLLGASQRHLRDLARDSDATVMIGVLRGDPDLVVVDAVSVLAPARGASLSMNSSAPPATAAGQAILAARPDLAGPPQLSDAEWSRARAAIRDRGFAVDNQTLVRGVCCVAAAIRRPGGQAVASVSVLTVAERVSMGHADLVRRAAARISRDLAAGRP